MRMHDVLQLTGAPRLSYSGVMPGRPGVPLTFPDGGAAVAGLVQLPSELEANWPSR